MSARLPGLDLLLFCPFPVLGSSASPELLTSSEHVFLLIAGIHFCFEEDTRCNETKEPLQGFGTVRMDELCGQRERPRAWWAHCSDNAAVAPLEAPMTSARVTAPAPQPGGHCTQWHYSPLEHWEGAFLCIEEVDLLNPFFIFPMMPSTYLALSKCSELMLI